MSCGAFSSLCRLLVTVVDVLWTSYPPSFPLMAVFNDSLVQLMLICLVVSLGVLWFLVQYCFKTSCHRNPDWLFAHKVKGLRSDSLVVLEWLKSALSIRPWRVSTRLGSYYGGYLAGNYPNTDMLTMQTLKDFATCYREHGEKGLFDIVVHEPEARCSRALDRLLGLATTLYGYDALEHYVGHGQYLSNAEADWTASNELPGRVPSVDGYPFQRVHKSSRRYQDARCADEGHYKLAFLTSLASCDHRPTKLQSCIASEALRLMEARRLCLTATEHLLPEGPQKREISTQIPSTRGATPVRTLLSHYPGHRVSACLVDQTQGPNAVVNKQTTGVPDHCHTVIARENTAMVVLIVVFLIFGALAFLCMMFRILKGGRREPAPADMWQSHRASIHDPDSNVFTDAFIPEMEETEDPPNSRAVSEKSPTGRWYSRLFKRFPVARNETQNTEDRGQAARRDVENVFVMPPAPNSRVIKKTTMKRTPLGRIEPNDNGDVQGHRVMSTGSAPDLENATVRSTSGGTKAKQRS